MITACLWQPTLPSAVFREPTAWGYGSGRVKWHVLVESPHRSDRIFVHGDIVCDAIFWQDEDWFQPIDYYTTYRKNNKAKAPMLSRIVAGWVSEKCLRSGEIFDNYDFVWYPGPRDHLSHLTPLPLGVSSAFPDGGGKKGMAEDLETFDFLTNYLASLETSPIRQTWFTDAMRMSKALPALGMCSFIRAHKKWMEPDDYEEHQQHHREWGDPDAFDHCTCENIVSCTNATQWGSLSSAQFASILKKSAFTLSPPGHNYQSFRHWEAAAVGSIPVVMNPHMSKSECVRSESYFFGDAPFLYASSPLEAYDAMIALTRNRTLLAKQRQRVRDWYDMHIRTGVLRVEAAMTAAASIASALFGSPENPNRRDPQSPVFRGNRTRPKRNAIALTLDGTLSNHLLAWLLDVTGVAAGRDYVEDLHDDGAVSVGWAYANQDDYADFLPKTPLNTILAAPVVLFARDPLAFIPELAKKIDDTRGNFSKMDDDLADLFRTKFTSPPGDFNSTLRLAADYWLQWTRSAYAMSSFDFHLERFDPVAALKALGLNRQPGIIHAEQKPFAVHHENPRLSWDDLVPLLDPADLNELRALASTLGYNS